MELRKLCDKQKMNKLFETSIPVENFNLLKNAEDKTTNKSLILEKPVRESMDNRSSINSAVVHSLFKIDETSENEAKRNEQKENKCYTFIKQHKILFWVERVFLFSICAAVAGGFTVPIIIYAVDTDRGNTTRLSSDLDFDTCANTVTQVCI